MKQKFTAMSALVLCFGAQPLWAAGFIEDSKATLKLRNMAVEADYKNQPQLKPNYDREWGQGQMLEYKSGYTDTVVGFGLDVFGMWGVRLDSGKGRHYNPTSTRYSGIMFPTDRHGRAKGQMASIYATGKMKYSQTEVMAGQLMPQLPVITFNDGRLLPQTFKGAQVTTNDVKDFTVVGGQLSQAKGRTSSNWSNLSIVGANNAQTGRFSNQFFYGGADWKAAKETKVQLYASKLQDFYSQVFLGFLDDKWQLGPGSLKTDLRLFRSNPSGENNSLDGRKKGYVSRGYWKKNSVYDAKTKKFKSVNHHDQGKVDNTLWSGMLTYSLDGHSLGGGYQNSTGNSDMPFLDQGDGSTAHLITDRYTIKFARAGEKSWIGNYDYDFGKIGVPGLKFNTGYISAHGIRTSDGHKKEWERYSRVDYTLPESVIKGMTLTWRNATFRSQVDRDVDGNRLIVNYSIPLL